MLNIIILLLKILGIVLAFLVGLVLLVIAIVLFVPICYRVKLTKEDEIYSLGKISWLMHVISIRGEYDNNKFKYYVKVFGYTMFASDKIKKVKTKQMKQKKRNKVQPNTITQKNTTTVDPVIAMESKKTLVKETVTQNNTPEHTVVAEQVEQINPTNTSSIFDKIKLFFGGIRKWFHRVRDKIKGLVLKCKNLKNAVIEIVDKSKVVIGYIMDESHRPGFKLIWKEMIRLLKHIMPRKIKGDLEFGTGDPCTTGYALGIIGMFYGKYANNIIIRPNFEDSIIKGEVEVKGHITLFWVVWILVKVILDKEFKYIVKEYKHMKENL